MWQDHSCIGSLILVTYISQISHAFGRSASRQEIVPRRMKFDETLTIRITCYYVVDCSWWIIISQFLHFHILLFESLTVTFWYFWAAFSVGVQVTGNGTSSANLPVAAVGSDSHMNTNEKNPPRAKSQWINATWIFPWHCRYCWGPMAKQPFLSLHTSQQLCFPFRYMFLQVSTVISFSFCGKLHCVDAHCCTVCDQCSSWLIGSLSSANA